MQIVDILGRFVNYIDRYWTRARFYQSVRTAHLERFHALAPAVVIYQSKRYDFDSRLATGLDLVQAGRIRAAFLLSASHVKEIEINEPLMLASLPGSFCLLVGIWVRRTLRRGRVNLVTYAIENRDPFLAGTRLSLKARLRRRMEISVAKAVWRRMDRIVYGTDAARSLYESRFADLGLPDATTIPALPAPCGCGVTPKDTHLVTFLGAFADRKGILRVLAAWPGVRQVLPSARLSVIGKGAHEAEVKRAASLDSTIELAIDPERTIIHAQLRRSAVLVLPSLPASNWKEQVGLPIVEGLAHGCKVVTTSETGIANWLVTNQHSVLSSNFTDKELSSAIVDQLADIRNAKDVIATLPDRDGRLLADSWLFGHESSS